MSNLFQNLTNDGLEETKDRLGGFALVDTDIYNAVIKMAYAGKSDEGANFVHFELTGVGERDYSETIYVTNKKGENWFLNKQDQSKKVPLPGFVTVDDICQVTIGKSLAEVEWEEKVVQIYDYDAKKEVPKSVMVATELLSKPLSLGILRKLVNKNVKNDATGKYEPGDETREENAIEKVFHTESKGTTVEAREGKPVGEFWDKWLGANKDKVRDARKKKDGGTAVRSGTRTAGQPPAAGGGEGAPARKSLFPAK